MATIAQTTSGKWKAIIRKTGWPTIIKTFRLKRDADDWARRTEDEMVRGVFIQRTSAERMTFADALKRYLAEITPRKKASTQISERRRAVILDRHFGKYSLAAINAELIAEFRDKRLTGDINPKTGLVKPRSVCTVLGDLALISHLFTVAIKEWRLGVAYNPVLAIVKPSPTPGRNRRLSPEEEDRLIPAIERHSNPMLRWIVGLALETSMRSSEVASLRLHQVDLDRRIAFLPDTKNNEPRMVPLSKTAAALLREAVAHPIRPTGCDLIFFGEPGRKDGKRRPYQFNKVWSDIRTKAGIKNFRFHDLRHEAVSRLVEGGLSDQEVSTISGHKSMQMLKRYTHLRGEDLVSRLDDAEAKRRLRRQQPQMQRKLRRGRSG